MKNKLCFAGLLVIVSCSADKSHTLTIKNDGKIPIDSARIAGPGADIFFRRITPGSSETKEVRILIENKSDGAFVGDIFMHSGDTLRPNFGYYTNTATIKNHLVLAIDSAGVMREND